MSFASKPPPNNFCAITPFVGGLETASLYVSALHLLTGVISFWGLKNLPLITFSSILGFTGIGGDL